MASRSTSRRAVVVTSRCGAVLLCGSRTCWRTRSRGDIHSASRAAAKPPAGQQALRVTDRPQRPWPPVRLQQPYIYVGLYTRSWNDSQKICRRFAYLGYKTEGKWWIVEFERRGGWGMGNALTYWLIECQVADLRGGHDPRDPLLSFYAYAIDSVCSTNIFMRLHNLIAAGFCYNNVIHGVFPLPCPGGPPLLPQPYSQVPCTSVQVQRLK